MILYLLPCQRHVPLTHLFSLDVIQMGKFVKAQATPCYWYSASRIRSLNYLTIYSGVFRLMHHLNFSLYISLRPMFATQDSTLSQSDYLLMLSVCNTYVQVMSTQCLLDNEHVWYPSYLPSLWPSSDPIFIIPSPLT